MDNLTEVTTEVGTHPSNKERNIQEGVKVKKRKKEKTRSKVILSS